MKCVYVFARKAVQLTLRVLYRHTAIFEYDPKNIHGAAIIAANHVSYLDPQIIAASFSQTLDFFAGEHLFQKRFARAFFKMVRTHPIKKGNELGSMRRALALLRTNAKVVLFPEGTRSKDGFLKPLKEGVAFLSIQAACPIIPCFIFGAFEAWPRASSFPKFFGVRTKIVSGKPIFPFDEQGRFRSKESITNLLQSELQRLSVEYSL